MSLQTQVQTDGGRVEAGLGLLPGGGATAARWGENTPSSPDHKPLTSWLVARRPDPVLLSQSLSYSLKTSHRYFTQVQCQLAVTGLQRADLVVFTLEETVFVSVTFDPERWMDTLSKLDRFYVEAYPHLETQAHAAAAMREGRDRSHVTC